MSKIRRLRNISGLVPILIAFGLIGIVYSLVTPLFEAPDEPWHYAYVRWLAKGHGLPRLDDNASGACQEVAQPPLYYAVAALVSSPVTDDDLPELFWHNPQFGYQAGGTVNDNKNMLIHTDRERFPWRGAVLAVRLARMVSLAFGLLAVAATFGLAREALPDRPGPLATAAAGVAAFTPQFLFIGGVVSNDSAAAATCTCALWALARIIRRGPTPRRFAAAGLALGLALLSKTSALLLLPMALLVIYKSANSQIRKWRAVILTLGLAGATGGWWYARNWILFDDPLGLGVHVNTPWGRTEAVGLMALLPELPRVFRSFWGAFGWGHVELPRLLYVALGGLVVLALLGWARHLLRRSIPAITAIYLLAAGWCLIVLAALLRWMQQVEAPHGRLLFPALGAWALLLVVGWAGVSRHSVLGIRDHSPPLWGGVERDWVFGPVAALFLLSLVVPFAVIQPAFVQPALLSPEQAQAGIIPRTLVYGDQVRLLGYRVEPELEGLPPEQKGAIVSGAERKEIGSVTAGESVKVTLCWEALHPMDQDYTLFIHLLGRDNLRVGERTSYPGQGRFPTSLWPVGRAFCDAYWLKVAPWSPAPELYALEVGLYNAETGWRLPAQDESGQHPVPIEPPTVGLVRVAPTAPPPQPEHPLSFNLGEEIALVGYDTQIVSGDALTLTLYWQAIQAPCGDYKVFVHLLDATGALITQDDTPPRGGRYPTWAWQPGDLVPDSHQLTLPDPRPAGPYHWLVGMYRPDTPTNERLPVTGPEGDLPDGAILLREIRESGNSGFGDSEIRQP